MIGQSITGRAAALGAAVLVGACSSARAEEQLPAANSVRIGMISSLFQDLPQATVLALMQPFGALMQSQTGVHGELVPGGDAENLGQLLASDKLQLGVFHGIEFAWARQKFPELKPLMIAVNQQRHLRALLIVRSESTAACLKDLQGKALALPRQSREHCNLFVERQCRQTKKELPEFFAKITNPPSVEDALDDVVDGIVQVTVVDEVSLECYKRRKPGRAAKLKTVQISEVFPAAVVAYRPGTLDEATLKKFRAGMLNASSTILGRQLLTFWKLSGFEMVPEDYDQTLLEIVKTYPAPASAGK